MHNKPAIYVAIVVIALLTIMVVVWTEQGRSLRRTHRAEIEGLTQEHEAKRGKEEETLKAYLEDAEVTSGRAARKKHDQEWEERLNCDRKHATGDTEKAILKMVEAAKDSRRSDDEALRTVAQLSSPQGASVSVVPQAGGHGVRIDFGQSQVDSYTPGSRVSFPRRRSTEERAKEIAARAIKNLYTLCRGRRIASVTVTCYRYFYGSRDRGSGLICRYGLDAAGAARVADWRRVPIYRVADMLEKP